MLTNTLILVRGLPGSAKSTLAKKLAPDANFAADDFFTDAEGNYNFDPSLIRQAHESCQGRTQMAMLDKEPVIAVHNTFSKAWEAKPYFELAERFGYSVFVVECQNDFGNIHGVPDHVIQKMRERLEPLRGELTPLWTTIKIRFWDWYYATKRRLRS